ncbi:non-ribosomal peptide synthase domain TIGR01720/amino acid adenylation domain-containing protein [Tistlia consotensis]|uniref:Non-ribosomal peptide synthase domain TIGR01720/amino acid adenylation domain-containing protein n=1 Tax=Tistlia consotensis USBA 355 TaxID=560819 RepID=A0A1Y6BAM3_9PROT|nr:hybrid non-ribosomal peptide synthetase/type I polyketide synthase [Tistlia consotensis]SME90667.1 non-ribosomal peptide synthase domain TIGR01720/amino acid adenylation domain-containing protein [Tistlia consotensis USBA 355]SNR26868.1 non-ribosomal peptide synthase domain TIGR01720/amino acid adenylation domain-containing protein [Tistlia consotensis]
MRPLDELFAELERLGVGLEAEGGALRVRGPAGSIEPGLRAELAARKAELLQALAGTEAPALAARPDSDAPAPLTFNQRRLWFLEKLGESGSSFAMTAAWELGGTLDVAALRRALGALTRRHAILRARIEEPEDAPDGEPRLAIAPWAPPALEEDRGAPDGVQALLETEAAAPFDLARGPLFRVRLVHLAEDRRLLLVGLHHLISDRWSMGILFRDLAALMRAELTGEPAGLPALPLQFADFADWQRGHLNEATLAPELAWWQQRLAGAPADPGLPLDRPRRPLRGSRGAAHRFALPAEADLTRLAARQGATAFMAYLAVYAALLARWSGQDELVVGCPLGSRSEAQTHELIGFFVNTVALRLDLSDDPSFASLLGRAREASLEAFQHQDAPFDRIVDALKPQRQLNRNPLFQAMFVLQTAEMSGLAWPGIEARPLELPPMAPEVDLNLALEPPAAAGAPFTGYLEYDPELFEAATAERFARQFGALARAAAAAPDTPISRLPLEDGPGASWQGPERPLPDARLDRLILDRLRDRPEAPALVAADGQTIAAGVLAGRATALAGRLLDAGLEPGQPVGLCLPRGPELVAGLLGVLAAGGAFVVLPSDAPAAHLARIAETAGLTLSLADRTTADRLPAGVAPLLVEELAEAGDAPPEAPAGTHAYLCFTSGSSGSPKGIAVGRTALLNHALAAAEAFGLGEGDRVLQFAAPAFDVALEEILPSLLAGAAVVLPPAEALDSLEAFGRFLGEAGITVANLPAPFWHAWVRELAESGGRPPASLRLLVTGSDRVHRSAAEQWQALAPDVAWLSGYGPSEATVTATLFDPRRDPLPAGAATVPLGPPLANVSVHLVDPEGRPVATDLVGEIVIEGAGLADGYLGEAAAAQAFRPRLPGCPPAYWTGDLGRRRGDGSLEFVGRRDGQLKIRGMRVEPAAAEAELARLPDAGEVAVVGRPDGGGGSQLAAFVTGPADPEALRRRLAERLPAHLVPATVERLESLPRTASGKLDRRALAVRPAAPRAAGTPPAFAGERERLVAQVFAEVLERDDIGPEGNFFELGGDSIRSLQIVARARRAGLALTARTIFQHQTVAAIAAAATPLDEEPEGPPGVGPLPLTPAFGWFREHVVAGWRHFNQAVVLAVPTPLDRPALEQALAALVACHDVLRLTVEDREGAFRCAVPETGPAPALTVVELAGLDGEARAARRAEAFAAAHESLDPARGRNLAAVLLPDEGRLLLTIHHLCVDVLSWRVLLDDLEAAYEAASRGRAPRLRRPATPFRLWAERMAEAAGSADAGDLTYWLGLLAHPSDLLLPEAGTEPGLDGDGASVQLALDKAVTTDVLRNAPAAYGVRPDEVILAALLLVLRRRGGSRLRVELERNGRVSPFEDLDLSRTVGWFTSIAPLLLDQEETDLAKLLPAIARTAADSPLDGLGFGLLRYLGGSEAAVLAQLPQAQILLNFVGELTGWNAAPFRPVVEDPGPTIAAESPRSHVLELNIGVVEGGLLLYLGFPGETGCAEAAAGLLDDLAAALGEIGRAARAARAGLELPPDVEATLPLTPLQRGILLHSLHEPETYFDQLQLTLHGPLDAAALREAWRRVAARHQALRAAFRFGRDGTPVQLIHESADPQWVEKDWRRHDAAEQSRRLAALLAADRATGFDLARAPLLRLTLVRCGEARHELVWSAHHLLLDGWSVSLVMAEVAALYRAAAGGAPAGLPAAPDFARYLGWLERADEAAAAAYWRQQLAGLEPCLLAGPGLAPAGAEPAGAPSQLALGPEEAQAVEALARSCRVTVGQVIQAAWALLLGRYTGRDEAAFGLTVSGRPPELPGVESLVGMLINTLPVRVALPGGAPVETWLQDLGAQAIERAGFAGTPLPDALSAAGLSAGSLPFDSLVLIQNYPRPKALDAGGLTIELARVAEATNFPVTLVAEWPRGTAGDATTSATLVVVRDPRRLSSAAARQILGHLRHLLQAMSRDPQARLDGLSLYDGAERERRLALGRGELIEVAPALAHEILDDWAELAPDAPAAVSWDGTLSYSRLAARSDALAARLAAAGVGPGSRVALAAPRSAALVAAFMAILKAGGAVVPLDVAYPEERLRFMLEDCGAVLAITDRAHRERLPLGGLPVLLLDEPETEHRPEPPPAWSPPAIDPESPAYVIYTSGSTGRPKGVLSPHRGLRALIAAQRRVFRLGPGDRVLQFASLSFDAAVWEIVMALGAGAALHLPSREDALAGPELGAYLRSRRITAATLPPSLLAVIPEGAYPDLRLLGVAGEACPPALARRWASGRRFFNGYGPSETTVCAAIFEGGGDGASLPIGRPIPNGSAQVVDRRLEPVPPGCEGELLVGGPGVALGYLGRPGLTAERFVADPFSEVPGARLYRTGDLVRVAADGTLVFLGRIDRQVKLRGFRIEPGEVEAVLTALPGVARALAAVRADRRGEQRLLAWILPASGARPDLDALRRTLKERLPGHMVPAAVIAIEAVPLTPNGKVDWNALPGDTGSGSEEPSAPAAAAVPATGGETGETTVRRRLAALWSELLDRPAVGDDDNFFDVGGHSLLLVQLQSRLRQDFGISLPVSELFAHPTVRALARRLVEQGAAAEVAAAEAAPAPAPAAEPVEATPQASGEPIAVIGMAGRFPGAPDLEAYWDLLVEGREGLTRFDRETLRRAGVPERLIDDPAFVPVGGILDDAEAFDPAVFGLGPRDALVLDPQHRVFLECAWHALEDAGYAPGASRGRIGLFAGSAYNTWLREVLVPAGEDLAGSGGFHMVTGNDKDFLATQTAYRLDLRGPALAVQTACSTSLVAVALAVEALQDGRCEMALAGGVAISFPQEHGYLYEPEMILSPDGHCRAFAADAAGTVPGSGAGVVLLKPLARARADGDRVLAVIRGAAVNNDGADKMGFTAPGVEGQAAAIRAALAAAGLERDAVDYVETHGTGTALGDPVEVTALARAYGGRAEPLLLGSVKSNIGHADAAAGIAGLIKAVLALSRGILPASLHALPANPRIGFAAGPFEVVAEARPWPQRDRPLRAGVSAFGIGGTNAHVILEAAPAEPDEAAREPAAGPQVLPLSAQSETALQRQAATLAAHLRAHPDQRLADVAFTLQQGRAALRRRRAVVAESAAEAAAALEMPGGGITGRAAVQPPAVALLLPGQGSQHPGMGRALYAAGGVFRRELDTLSEQLRPLLGLSLAELLYGDGAAGPEALRRTEIAQPAVFAVSLALARQWQALGLTAEGLLGHSVGEYVAACLAGVFGQAEALALIVERGRLIGALPGGAMLAVNGGEAEVRALLDAPGGEGLALAAVNGPRLCVVSGPEAAVAALEARLAEAGRPGRRLQTSHAFHSPMLAPAAEALAEAVARARPKPPRERFVSNVTGRWITADEATDPGYWARHLLSAVRFADGLATLREAGIALAVECGPGQALTALARGAGLTALPSLAHAVETPAGGSRLEAAAAGLWVEGVPLDWPALHAAPRRRVSLPLYPFERRLFRPEPRKRRPVPQAAPLGKRPAMAEWFYRPGWTPAPAAEGAGLDGPWLILADAGGVAATLAERLARDGQAVTLVEAGERFENSAPGRFSVRPAEAEDFRRLLAALDAPPRRVLHLWGLDEAAPETLEERGLHALLALMQALGSALSGRRLRLDLATLGAADVTGEEALRPELAAAVGALRVLPHEYPETTVRAIDLEPAPAEARAEQLAQELALGGAETVVARRGGTRWVPGVSALPLPERPAGLRRDGLVLITGAFGGVGAALARDLAREPGMRLLLLGRQPLPGRDEWEARIADGDPLAPRLRLVRELEAAGAEVVTAALDLADGPALAEAVRAATARFGPVTGAIHAAGLADLAGVVQNRGRADTERVLAPKVAGTRALEAALAGQPLDFLVLCSTLGSFLPAAKFGQVAYAAANEFLDLAAAAIARRSGWRTVAVNWDDWVEAGMTVEAHRTWGTGLPTADDGLTAAEGAAALRRILAGREPRVAVSVRDLPAMIAEAETRFDPLAAPLPPKRAEMPEAPGAAANAVPPADADALAAELTGAFRRVLDDPELGADDSFFERGGHSLLAMKLLAFLRERFGLGLGIAAVFDHPTPRGLADEVRRQLAAREKELT